MDDTLPFHLGDESIQSGACGGSEISTMPIGKRYGSITGTSHGIERRQRTSAEARMRAALEERGTPPADSGANRVNKETFCSILYEPRTQIFQI